MNKIVLYHGSTKVLEQPVFGRGNPSCSCHAFRFAGILRDVFGQWSSYANRVGESPLSFGFIWNGALLYRVFSVALQRCFVRDNFDENVMEHCIVTY